MRTTEIHMRVPTFLGSMDNVYELDQFHQYYDDEEKSLARVQNEIQTFETGIRFGIKQKICLINVNMNIILSSVRYDVTIKLFCEDQFIFVRKYKTAYKEI